MTRRAAVPITIRNLRKTYGDVCALDSVDLDELQALHNANQLRLVHLVETFFVEGKELENFVFLLVCHRDYCYPSKF